VAASITHLVVGEHAFKHITCFNPTLAVYGSFLMGCMVVDVHALHDIDRRQTHFAGRFEKDGEYIYRKSCSTFLSQLGTLLQRSWSGMAQTEQAFVAGYLCHLAADECWQELRSHLFQKQEITSWTDLTVPPDVTLTAFDFLSHRLLIDADTVFAALQEASVPDVFRHVPCETFRHQWDLTRDYVLRGGTPEAYLKMQEGAGKPEDRIQELTRQHAVYWEEALNLVCSIGGVLPYIQRATARTVEVIPELWIHPTGNRVSDFGPCNRSK